MSKNAGIYREALEFETNFTQVPNAWVRDPKLTLKAKGLLTYLLSHEAGFTLTLDRISRDTKDERTAIRSAVGELVAEGYVVTKQGRQRDGRLGPMTWVIHDPATASRKPTTVNPTAENVTTIEEHLKEKHLKETITQDFETFYSVYPRRMERKTALKAFIKALAGATADEIITGAKRFAQDPNLPPMGFVPYPATWLNAGSWEDEALPERVKSKSELDQEAQKAYDLRKIRLEAIAKRDQLARREEAELAKLNSSAPPKCVHGSTLARCVPCVKQLKETEGTK